jgi:tetratricopeptide (TPR) repeat protein
MFGMVLDYCTIDMPLSTTPRKPFQTFSILTQITANEMRSTSVSVSYTSSKRDSRNRLPYSPYLYHLADYQCFNYILSSPPEPLTTANIYTQIGYVHQVAGDYALARDAFETVLVDEPESPKVLLQLGYIYSVPNTRIRDLPRAHQYINKALEIGTYNITTLN